MCLCEGHGQIQLFSKPSLQRMQKQVFGNIVTIGLAIGNIGCRSKRKRVVTLEDY